MFPGQDRPEHTPQGKPLSLHPLPFEEAVRDLLQVEPEPKKPKAKAKRKPTRAGERQQRKGS
jgi:hypothetical protein